MNKGNEKDGTILSIDFKNAFRSVSLRWFNLVLRRLHLPEPFIEWFWKMYENLGIMIVVNGFKSDIIRVLRGFMEGHPASMGGFVVSLIPLMISLNQNLQGIEVQGKRHKIKMFADDLKTFLKNIYEIDVV